MYKLGYQLILPRIYIVLVVAFSFQVVIHAHAFASLIDYKANQSEEKKGKKMACAYLCAQQGTSESILNILVEPVSRLSRIYFHYYMPMFGYSSIQSNTHGFLGGLRYKLV